MLKKNWSRLNYWYCGYLRELKDNTTLVFSGAIIQDAIIESNFDIELYNWGNSFITTVDILADNPRRVRRISNWLINSSRRRSIIIFPNNDFTLLKKI